MYCNHCGAYIPSGSAFCGECGKPIPANTQTPPPIDRSFNQTAQAAGQQATKAINGFVKGVSNYMGNSNSVKMNWKTLFAAVFKKHTNEEAGEVFTCGTARTTPPLSEVSESWPTPWLYSRVFFCFAITYFILQLIFNHYQNRLTIPGIIFVGSFAVPLTTLILFMELNVFRNISFFDVIKFFMIGGVASLLICNFLFDTDLLNTDISSTWGAMGTGIVEEVAKMVIVFWLIKRIPTCNFILSALLAGACVGAGFAAFESAGYALIFSNGNFEQMTQIILTRGLLAPGGHVAWAAISGAALVIAKGDKPLTFDVFTQARFWKIFAIPVVLHGLWDAPIFDEHYLIKDLTLTVLVWTVVLILVNMGLDQVKTLRSKATTIDNAQFSMLNS